MKNKSPSKSLNITLNKTSKSEKFQISTDNYYITWKFSIIDAEGKWGWKKITGEKLWQIIHEKIKNFETMTWSDLPKIGSHAISKENISKDAQKRLKEINQDDIDNLFSLRLKGIERIWGIRDGSAFKILWWDPYHEVCVSFKKGT